jgi:hypothetical protein
VLASTHTHTHTHARAHARLLTPRYRALLGLSGAAAGRAGGKSWGGGAGADGDGDGDDASDGERGGGPGSTAAAKQWGGRQQRESLEMSVTFQPGLDKLGPALLARKAEAKARAGDSVWDAYLRCVCKGGGGGGGSLVGCGVGGRVVGRTTAPAACHTAR